VIRSILGTSGKYTARLRDFIFQELPFLGQSDFWLELFAHLNDRREKPSHNSMRPQGVLMSKAQSCFAKWALLILGCLFLLVSGCGGGGGGNGGGGSEYDYGITLNPSSTTVAPGGTVNLNVHQDAPPNNAGITWKLTCAQTDCGSVSSAGIYKAPAAVSAQMVVGIKATSNDRPSMGYYVEIWVTGPIVVTISPDWAITLVTNATQQYTATVNSPDTGIIWQVNGVVGGNSTVGTISTSGLYTAPAQVPDPATVTVTAVAHTDQTASVSRQVTITAPPPVSVQITPRDQTVGTGGTLQFTATVQNSSDTAVQWQVNGIAGGNSTVGTISTTGLFTAPSAVPSPALETITAVSHADSTKSDSTHVTIAILKNSLLNGPYSFEINGFDSGGVLWAAIGYLNFDGNGAFAAMMDINFTTLTTGAQTALQYTGTYSVGQDDRGTMTFAIDPALTLAFTLNETGNDAKLIEYDTRGTRYVGTMQKQTPADFTLAKLTGDYAFSVYGVTMDGTRQVAVGRFHADGAGHITAAALDSKEGSQPSISLTDLTGTATVSDSTRGGGTFTLNQSGTVQTHFNFYMTDAGDIYILSTDAVPSDNPLLVGHILSQTGGPFSNASLNGPGVFSLAGVGASNPADSCLVVGEWYATSSTQELDGTQDLNCDGAVYQGEPFTGGYTIDTNGRGTAGGSGQLVNVFYMISNNKAFLIGTLNVEDYLGMVEPQP